MSENLNKPTIFREGTYSIRDLNDWRKQARVWDEYDIYKAQLKELFEINNPSFTPDVRESAWPAWQEEQLAGVYPEEKGNWVYFPWNGSFIHTVNEADYYALRTNRNRNLITLEEQVKLRNFRVGCVGLSVGSSIATTLAYLGFSTFKLAEFDTLETSNLNRIRAGLADITLPKITVLERQIYEIDPYSQLESFAAGLANAELTRFVLSEPRPQLIFEIIDSFEMKILLRQMARQARIPVIMVTNLGDRVLIDVERYDLDSQAAFFNGRAGAVPQEILEHPDTTTADKHHYAVALAGEYHVPPRALASVAEIGTTLVGRPQLASTVTTAAGLCSYLTRQIALGEDVPSCSWLVNFDTLFNKVQAL